MDLVETEKLLTATNFFYPNFLQGREPSDIARAWGVKLKELDFNNCIAYLDKHVETSNFAPTIADFLQNASTDNKYLSSNQAYEIAMVTAKKYGFYRSDEAMESLRQDYPIIYQAVRSLGGFSVIINNELGLKTRFANHYSFAKDSDICKSIEYKADKPLQIKEVELLTEEQKQANLKRFADLKLSIVG